MTRRAYLPPWGLIGWLTLLSFIASSIGPLLAWAFWPPSNHMGQSGDFLYNFVNLLWPTRILALGTTDLSMGAIMVLVLSNMILYLFVGGLSAVAAFALKIHPSFAFQLLIAIPIICQLWFAGFDMKFIEWIPFTMAVLFYCVIGIAASLVMKQTINRTWRI